jgi:hypothetical protein
MDSGCLVFRNSKLPAAVLPHCVDDWIMGGPDHKTR